jgi:hypothetical protein
VKTHPNRGKANTAAAKCQQQAVDALLQHAINTMSSSPGPLSPQSTAAPSSVAAKAADPLSSKITTVLSSSYADTEFREALALLDERGVQNTAETRRQLRLDLQKEVIDSNGEIIDEFAKVAEV